MELNKDRWYTFCGFHKEERLKKEEGTWSILREKEYDTCDYNTRKGRCGAEAKWEFYPGERLGTD